MTRPLEPIPLTLQDADPDAFAAALGGAFAARGFAVVSEAGLDPALIARALDDVKAFFARPEAEKRRFHIPGGQGQRGYTPFGVETAKGATLSDLKEFWHVGRELPPGHPLSAVMPANLWPDAPRGFRASLSSLYDALDALGERLLRALALHLGLEERFLADAARDGNSILRLLHYPPIEGAAEGLRAGAHEDINAITLLLGAEEAGLEILEADGSWLAVSPPPGAVVVNIGDMLARLANDVLPSTTHRVVNPQGSRRGVARYSAPFFVHFRPDFVIQTLPGCISTARPDRYPGPITADAFLRQRLEEIKLG